MALNLPTVLWEIIFSHLDFKSLCNARAVCSTWWEIINQESVWKPLVMERNISRQATRQINGRDIEKTQVLRNCKSAKKFFRYYRNVHRITTNWYNKWGKTTSQAFETYNVQICEPFMFRITFGYPTVVEVSELRRGDFVHMQNIIIPVDPYEYEPGDDFERPSVVMNSDNIFAVTKHNYLIIYKLNGVVFRFEKAVFFTEPVSFQTCLDEFELPRYIGEHFTTENDIILSAVTEDVVWMSWMDNGWNHENEILCWNHLKQEIILNEHTNSQSPLTQFSREYVFCKHESHCSIYSIKTCTLLWRYDEASVISVELSRLGCGIILLTDTGRYEAMHVELSSKKTTKLAVVEPVAITILERLHLAYCLCDRHNIASIQCASTKTGALLWLAPIGCHLELNNGIPRDLTRMHLIHEKYIFVTGIDATSEKMVSADCSSLFSASVGDLIWSHHFGSMDYQPNSNCIMTYYFTSEKAAGNRSIRVPHGSSEMEISSVAQPNCKTTNSTNCKTNSSQLVDECRDLLNRRLDWLESQSELLTLAVRCLGLMGNGEFAQNADPSKLVECLRATEVALHESTQLQQQRELLNRAIEGRVLDVQAFRPHLEAFSAALRSHLRSFPKTLSSLLSTAQNTIEAVAAGRENVATDVNAMDMDEDDAVAMRAACACLDALKLFIRKMGSLEALLKGKKMVDAQVQVGYEDLGTVKDDEDVEMEDDSDDEDQLGTVPARNFRVYNFLLDEHAF